MQANSTKRGWWQTVWHSVVLASGLALAGPHLFSAAYGQSQPPSAQALDAAPWPVLDDGRVVFTVYGVKIAMPTCPACLDYEFYGFAGDLSPARSLRIKVRDAIAQPERLRYLEANTDKIRLVMGNDWRPEVNRGPFLGHFDPRSLPRTAELSLFLLKQARPEPCWTGRASGECRGTHELDVSGRRTDQMLAGMNFIPGPYTIEYRPSKGRPFFDLFFLQPGDVFYLAPTDHARDAIGLPVRFLCVALGRCYNSEARVEGGYALRRNVDVFLFFPASDYAPSEWVAMHDRVVNAVGTLIIDTP